MGTKDLCLETRAERPGQLKPLPGATLGRIQRERQFYNHAVEVASVDEALLRVPANLEQTLEREMASLARAMSGKRVCDYGCGWGVLSCFFAQRGACVYSFDVSDVHVALAHRAMSVNRVADRVFPQVTAAEWLAYPSNFFDFVIGNAVLHHVDIACAAPEIYRVLKPGGRAVFAEPLGENLLLEWARGCPLRSAAHRHTQDEHSLVYGHIRQLERYFDHVEVRETRLLRMAVRVLQEFTFGQAAGMTGDWLAWLSTLLERAEDWLLSRCAWLRPLCQYVVVTLHKRDAWGPVP